MLAFHDVEPCCESDDDLDLDALTSACEQGHLSIVKMLLADPRTNEAIGFASENGHVEIVQMLMEDPHIDPCASDNYAFVWATKCGHTDVTEMLRSD